MTSVNIPKFILHYHKSTKIDFSQLDDKSELTDNSYNQFNHESVQNYNPLYGELFELTQDNYNMIALNHKYHFLTMGTVKNQETKEIVEKRVFIKYSPLLDPERYMVGKYESQKHLIHVLPNIVNTEVEVHPKINDPNNAAYTDAFFSYLSSQLLHTHDFIHSNDFYGSFVSIQDKFKVDIADDIEYLCKSNFFKNNEGTLFNIMDIKNMYPSANNTSHANKNRILISNTPKHNLTAITIDELDDSCDSTTNNIEVLDPSDCLVYKNGSLRTNRSSSSSGSDSSSLNESSDDETASYSDESVWETNSDDSTDDDDSSEDLESIYAYINKFPVQMICLEKCDATLDSLLENDELGCDEAIAALFQIIMILVCYQKSFHFTHNDLHTNNIMYVSTPLEYLYYKYDTIVYKVPTFGRIFKIIDFGRSIYRFNRRIFCSDSFSPGGDAATQYNCEPYFMDDKPRIEPNYSFDLCRLGCSIYDFIIDNDPDEILDEFQSIIMKWCHDDHDKNILYKKNGQERYPHFKLYKMIARNVHNQVPSDQLKCSSFSKFAVSTNASIDKKVSIIDIDVIPVYA